MQRKIVLYNKHFQIYIKTEIDNFNMYIHGKFNKGITFYILFYFYSNHRITIDKDTVRKKNKVLLVIFECIF